MGDAFLSALAEEHGTPLFVYDGASMRARARAVIEAFEGELSVHYATKANAHPDVLDALRGVVAGVDVTSLGAMRLALGMGYSDDAVQFTAPGKSREDLRAAADARVTIVVGCVQEGADLAAVVREADRAPGGVPVLVRINPAETIQAFRSATGGVSPFGIPEEEASAALAELRALGLRPKGLHVHRGSQCTSASAYVRHVTSTLDLAERLWSSEGEGPHVNFGGGLGVASSGEALDLASLGRRAAKALRRFRAAVPGATFAIEPGRYLVSEAGSLVLRVLRRRKVRGTTFLVLDGGIDVFLYACERIRHGAPPPIRVLGQRSEAQPKPVTLVGPACTAEDTLTTDLPLAAAPGDLLVVEHAGAYAAHMSIRGFLGREEAREVVAYGAPCNPGVTPV